MMPARSKVPLSIMRSAEKSADGRQERRDSRREGQVGLDHQRDDGADSRAAGYT
jgi:hypothetical protein